MSTDQRFYPGNSQKNDATAGIPKVQPPLLPPITTTQVQDPTDPKLLPNALDPTGPPPPRGAIRFTEEIRRSGFGYLTDPYNDFVLRMLPDPNDPEYSSLVAKAQAEVNANIAEKQQQRMEANRASLGGTPALTPTPTPTPTPKTKVKPGKQQPPGQYASLTTDQERALDRDQKRQANIYIGPTSEFVNYAGDETDPDKQSLGDTLKPGSQSASTAGDTSANDYSDVTDEEYIKAGGAVWVGDADVAAPGGKHVMKGQYRNASDMMGDVYRWNPQQTMAFQKSLGLTPTGVADDNTVAAWKWAVNAARYYTAMGQKRSIDSILAAGKSSLKGTGGGGGGGGSAAVPADAAKRLLNVAMKQYAGREATQDELKEFLPAIRGAASSSDFDGTQFASDWVRGGSNGARSGEVASFQAATDYYAVVQQVLGGG